MWELYWQRKCFGRVIHHIQDSTQSTNIYLCFTEFGKAHTTVSFNVILS